MATETYQTQLERVQATLASLEARGQEMWWPDGRRITRVDYKALLEREAQLRRLVARESGAVAAGPRRVIVGF